MSMGLKELFYEAPVQPKKNMRIISSVLCYHNIWLIWPMLRYFGVLDCCQTIGTRVGASAIGGASVPSRPQHFGQCHHFRCVCPNRRRVPILDQFHGKFTAERQHGTHGHRIQHPGFASLMGTFDSETNGLFLAGSQGADVHGKGIGHRCELGHLFGGNHLKTIMENVKLARLGGKITQSMKNYGQSSTCI